MKTKQEILTEKLNSKLSNRRHDILDAMQHIEKSGEMLNDFIVPSNKLMFGNGEDGIVRVGFGDEAVKLHPNAVSQLAGRFNVNAKDLNREMNGSDWERQVFVNRMQAYADRSQKQNLLIRKVDDQAKGILSDKYKRLNTAAIFLAFLQAAVDVGSVLVDANHGELRDFLEVIHPTIIEIPTEKNGTIHTVFGAQIRNSDFGASMLQLKVFQMNVVCLNGLVSNSMIAERHLGSRIEEGGNVTFASDTVEADTRARSLQVRDIMKSVYSPENLERERSRIVDASEIELDFSHEIKALPKSGMLQSEIEMLNKALYESDPENGLQGKNTLWKLAQGITHIANEVESKDRRRDLQDIASTMFSNYVK